MLLLINLGHSQVVLVNIYKYIAMFNAPNYIPVFLTGTTFSGKFKHSHIFCAIAPVRCIYYKCAISSSRWLKSTAAANFNCCAELLVITFSCPHFYW